MDKLWRNRVVLHVLLGFCVAVVGTLTFSSAWAEPSREEAFRNEELNLYVYKDGSDPEVYWYLPPLRWLEQDGRLVWYKRSRGDRVDYYFYVTPYMTDQLLSYIASEIPNVRRQSQLRPVQLKRLGIRVPQFDISVIGGDATDYQYLNTPQLIRLTLDTFRSEDFEFFLNNPPGIQVQVYFFYVAERVDRYINLELSCSDVYSAMRVGVAGKYEFVRAEIEDRVFEYLANRHLYIRSKGDIPMPDIVNRAIAECFVPIQPPRVSAQVERLLGTRWSPRLVEAYNHQVTQLGRVLDDGYVPPPAAGMPGGLPGTGLNPSLPGTRPLPGAPGPGLPGTPGVPQPGPIVPPAPGPGPGPRPPYPGSPTPPQQPDGIMFQFRRDTAEVTRNFYFRREQVSNSEEVTAIPIMMSMNPSSPPRDVDSTPYPQRDFVIEIDHVERTPFRTGIQVGRGDQFLISAVFSLYAESAYANGRNRLRWDSSWPSPDEDLYYRVGTGPWVAVNGRALIRSDSMVTGELQLYMNRSRIWEKLPEDMRRPRFLLPPVLRFRTTYPQFNVTVTGRRVGLAP
jgi:hypothetical protein